MTGSQGRGRLIPYYLYMSTVATMLLPVGAMLLPAYRNGEGGTRVVQFAFMVGAVHLLAVGGMLLANWRGAIPQLRGISRIQVRKWAWCRMISKVIYRDTAVWWKAEAVLLFVPAGVIYLIYAYASR